MAEQQPRDQLKKKTHRFMKQGELTGTMGMAGVPSHKAQPVHLILIFVANSEV